VNIPQHLIEPNLRNKELAELISSIANDDQSAMSTLYDTTNRLVYGLLLRILNDSATAEEVLLDVYTQVWRQASRYDGTRGGPMAWITTIARSRAIDRLRSEKQTTQREESIETVVQYASSEDVEGDVANTELRTIIRRAMEVLTSEQREVIELAYFNGMSQSEIALKLNQPLGTVKTRTRIGMMRLRETLRPVLLTEQ
jgi:RNA polymerase sigma-70 factor (ECF subfamily)